MHFIDRCPRFDRAGHTVQERTTLVDYVCSTHSLSYAGDEGVEDCVSDDDDTASIFSDVATASTNLTFPDGAKQEAADRLFHELLNESSLRHVWPQIVKNSYNKGTAIKIIARYLGRFSLDLRAEANSLLEKDAAQFVGASRLSVADRIVECHINELIGEDEWANVITKTAVVGEDTDADDLETDERDNLRAHTAISVRRRTVQKFHLSFQAVNFKRI